MTGQAHARTLDATESPPPRGITSALLRWAATADSPGAGGLKLPVEAWGIVDDRHLQHIIDAGLGPLLRHAAGDTVKLAPGRWFEDLESAELTARFAHAALRDGAGEVIDVCHASGVPVTLLKGISISDQYWPIPHLRPMGDVDVLLPEGACALVDSALRSRGYTPMAGFVGGEGDAHEIPLLDPCGQVWIELHTALFPAHSRVNSKALFGPANVAARSIAFTWDGRSTLRLADELQLVYIATYWLRDIRRDGLHPTLLVPLFDAMFLLKGCARSLDWDGVLRSLDNGTAIASLYVLLTQVRRYGFDDEAVARVLPQLAAAQRIVGGAEMRAINWMLDSCLVDGRQFLGSFGRRHPMIESSVMDTLLEPHAFVRKLLTLPWNFVFPPRVPERYSVRYHAQRIARLFRRAGDVT
jgi:hypothetical protein